MKKIAIIFAGVLAVASTPAFAQGRSGSAPGLGAGNAGGGFGNSQGAGPPSGTPGWSSDPRSAAGGVAESQGRFGRDFAQQRQLTQAEQAQLIRQSIKNYQSKSESHKLEAIARRDAALAGEPLNMSSKEIRKAFKQDMEDWRDAFRISREDWQSQRDLWLLDADALTPEEWAARRAGWFEARDAWIAQQVEWAKSHSNDG